MLQLLIFFTTKVTKEYTFNVGVNTSDHINHFDIYVKIHQGALLAQKNQNKHRSDDTAINFHLHTITK